MCGIAGICSIQPNRDHTRPITADDVTVMLSMIEHRGPDGFGVYCDGRVGLGNARLSIVDLAGGFQPISNEDGSVWIVYNGEVFNHHELRRGLEQRGHHFGTHTDTEVIVHLYEEMGIHCLHELNGQFALAIWDSRNQGLMLARDRLGVRPLYMAQRAGQLFFASEIKALLAQPIVREGLSIDRVALEQIFIGWSVIAPRTLFTGIEQLPPGHVAMLRDGELKIEAWWQADYTVHDANRNEADLLDELDALLTDAVRLRMLADVPVGAYLSGGLDSSLTTALASRFTDQLETFSIAFTDAPTYDEQPYQRLMSSQLNVANQVVECTQSDIGRIFPQVVWHSETALTRTAPAPMMLLSGLVRQHGMKVVLTGEGADELFAGYDLFAEMKIRRFWARQPDSTMRPALLKRLYPDIAALSGINAAYRNAFFKQGLNDVAAPFYAHALRWANGARARRFLNIASTDSPDAVMGRALDLPDSFDTWSPLSQALYVEARGFLSPMLLSSQGDRMGMANSIEGRFPFLDHRIVQFANGLPDNVKMRGLTEKWLLKQLGMRYLPNAIVQRKKTPYRAPIQHCFFSSDAKSASSELAYVRDVLAPESLKDAALFQQNPVAQLVQKASQPAAQLSEMESMALGAVISAQLAHQLFIKDFRVQPANTQLLRKVVTLEESSHVRA